MSDQHPMPLRFTSTLVLSTVCLAYNGGDYATALREWRPLAEQGDPSAQFRLGSLYENGDGVPRDFAKARQWYEKAAAQGEAKSQFCLGNQSAYGEGGPWT